MDAHLVESKAPDRYQFHDLLRVYSSERAAADLPEPDREAAIRRLLTWYMRTTNAAATAVLPHRYNMPLEGTDDAGQPPLSFTGAEDALGWYDSERANVVTAARQAFACGMYDIAWRLPAPLFIVFNRRHNGDCIGTHRIALESTRRAGNRQGEAWVLNNLGDALGRTNESEGISHLEQALAIRREIGDRIGEAQAANDLADAYGHLGRIDETIGLLRRALELNRYRLPVRRRRCSVQPGRGSLWASTVPRTGSTPCNKPPGLHRGRLHRW